MTTHMLLIATSLCIVPIIGRLVRALIQLIISFAISAFVIMFILLVLILIASHASIGLCIPATYRDLAMPGPRQRDHRRAN